MGTPSSALDCSGAAADALLLVVSLPAPDRSTLASVLWQGTTKIAIAAGTSLGPSCLSVAAALPCTLLSSCKAPHWPLMAHHTDLLLMRWRQYEQGCLCMFHDYAALKTVCVSAAALGLAHLRRYSKMSQVSLRPGRAGTALPQTALAQCRRQPTLGPPASSSPSCTRQYCCLKCSASGQRVKWGDPDDAPG